MKLHRKFKAGQRVYSELHDGFGVITSVRGSWIYVVFDDLVEALGSVAPTVQCYPTDLELVEET